MKKVTAFFLAIIMMFSLVGCSAQKPEAVVEEYCSALKAFDLVKMVGCLKQDTESIDEFNEFKRQIEAEGEKIEPIYQYVKENAAKITYEIGDVQQAEDGKAVVNVTFNYVDASNVITATISDYVIQGLVMALGGADEAKLEELAINIFKEKMKVVETGTSTTTVKFNCEKIDGKWKIVEFSEEDGKAMLNVITLNMVKAVEWDYAE